MSSFPSTIVTYTNPAGTNLVISPDHAAMHTSENNEIIAVETKVGVGSGTPTLNKILIGSGNGTSVWGTEWDNGLLGTPTIYNPTIGTPAITGGTANAITLGTPTIGTITVPGTVAALSFSAAVAPGIGTITDVAGGTLTINAQQGQVFYSAMGTAAGNRTIAAPLNLTAGQVLTFAFKSSGSANGTLVWNAIFRISQDIGTPALGTGTSWNYYAWRYNSIDTKLDFAGQSKNIV